MESIEQLANLRCQARRGPEHALSRAESEHLISLCPGWALSDQADRISKDFTFKDYHQTMAFVNAVAWIAHREDHHPDMEVGYGHCLIRYNTHDVGGLSQNDFVCAAKIEVLAAA